MLMVLFNNRIQIVGSRGARTDTENVYNSNSLKMRHVGRADGGAGTAPIAFASVRVEEQTWQHTDQGAISLGEQVRYMGNRIRNFATKRFVSRLRIYLIRNLCHSPDTY